MKLRGTSPEQRWLGVWGVGAALTLGCYFGNAIQLPRQTEVGVEWPICGTGSLSAELLESASSREWLLFLMPADTPEAGSGSGASQSPRQLLPDLHWPGEADTPRRLAPFEPTGIWWLEGTTLHRIWKHRPWVWLDDGHLWAPNRERWPLPVTILDLRTGRTKNARSSDVTHGDSEGDYTTRSDYEQEDWDPELWSTLSSGLEELPSDFARGWQYGRDTVGDRGVYLVHTLGAHGEPVALYAVADEPAARILRLATRARPLALSRDGRALFFERDEVLWRLELRKPLPALLDELSVPELPDPLAGSTSRARPARARARRGRR
jgi:hypothetical protein